MMWEGEYYEWAKTAPAGFLTEEEAKRNWKTWLADLQVERDQCGPRMNTRLKIWKGTRLMTFEEQSKAKSLLLQEKQGNNATQEQLEDKLKSHVYGNSGAGDMGAFGDAMGSSFQGMLSAEGGSAMSTDGLLGPDIELWMQEFNSKKRKGKSFEDLENLEEDDEEEEMENEAGSNPSSIQSPAKKANAKGSPSQPGKAVPVDAWFDEGKATAAERSFDSGAATLRGSLHSTHADMMVVLAEFRQHPEGAQARRSTQIANHSGSSWGLIKGALSEPWPQTGLCPAVP